MKKQTIIILALLVGFAMPALAQNKNKKVEDRIQLAREKYAEGLALVAENEEEGRPGYATVVREQMWAAIGDKTDRMEFYYNELRDEEENPYPDAYALRMVRRTYNITVRDHLQEYLFDDQGKPLFYFTHFTELVDESDCGFPLYVNAEVGLPEFELRLYYDEKGKVIRTIYKTLDENGKMKEISESQVEPIKGLFLDPDFTYVKKVFDAVYQNK